MKDGSVQAWWSMIFPLMFQPPRFSLSRPGPRVTRLVVPALLVMLFLVALPVRGEAATMTLFLVEERAYLSGEQVTVNVHLLKQGKGVEPDEHPQLQINPDQFANEQRESRNVTLSREAKGHYRGTFTIQSSDYDELGNMFLRVPFKVKGELIKSDHYLDVEVGYLPLQSRLTTSRPEALPGETVLVNFTLVDRTDGYRLVTIDELELTYQLPGDSRDHELNYELTTGLAKARLTLPADLEQGGAVVLKASGSSGDEQLLEYATLWVPLIRLWVHQQEVTEQRISWQIWAADSQGLPMPGVELDLSYSQRDSGDHEVGQGSLDDDTDLSGSVSFVLDRVDQAQFLYLEGTARYPSRVRDFTYFWNLGFTEPVRLSPITDDLLNNTFAIGSPLRLDLMLHQGDRALNDREVSLLVISEQGLLDARPWITDERGRIGLSVELPQRPGPLEVAVEDVVTGGWASWSTWVHDPGLDLEVPKLNLTRPSTLLLTTTQIMRFPSLEIKVIDELDQQWFAVRDPHNDAALPYRYSFSSPPGSPEQYHLQLQLPAFVPSNGVVELEVRAENIARGRTVSAIWSLRPGMSTEREYHSVVPATSGDAGHGPELYLSLLALVLALGGSAALSQVYRRRRTEGTADLPEDLWDLPQEAPAGPELPTQPYYGAPAGAQPQLLTVACPLCAQPMGVPYAGQPVLVNCPHCARQCRVG